MLIERGLILVAQDPLQIAPQLLASWLDMNTDDVHPVRQRILPLKVRRPHVAAKLLGFTDVKWSHNMVAGIVSHDIDCWPTKQSPKGGRDY